MKKLFLIIPLAIAVFFMIAFLIVFFTQDSVSEPVETETVTETFEPKVCTVNNPSELTPDEFIATFNQAVGSALLPSLDGWVDYGEANGLHKYTFLKDKKRYLDASMTIFVYDGKIYTVRTAVSDESLTDTNFANMQLYTGTCLKILYKNYTDNLFSELYSTGHANISGEKAKFTDGIITVEPYFENGETIIDFIIKEGYFK